MKFKQPLVLLEDEHLVVGNLRNTQNNQKNIKTEKIK